MSSRVDAIMLAPIAGLVRQHVSVKHYEDIYEGNRHRIFSLAFYMTHSEPEAEELMSETFCRAFRAFKKPTAEQLDRALVSELRTTRPIGPLTLQVRLDQAKAEQPGKERVCQNTKRTEMEEAVVQLPATERMIFLMHDVESYDHARIAKTMGISQEESKAGLFQARMRIREILSNQQSAISNRQ
ncbi:MAG: sigma-70 family RNA polymerase sigma factor [Acidobacteriaceae bacterium]